MSWTGRGGRRSYHHGNLREALISAALDRLPRRTGGLHLRRSRAPAGVGPAAPTAISATAMR
jgi:hypothetical protein